MGTTHDFAQPLSSIFLRSQLPSGTGDMSIPLQFACFYDGQVFFPRRSWVQRSAKQYQYFLCSARSDVAWRGEQVTTGTIVSQEGVGSAIRTAEAGDGAPSIFLLFWRAARAGASFHLSAFQIGCRAPIVADASCGFFLREGERDNEKRGPVFFVWASSLHIRPPSPPPSLPTLPISCTCYCRRRRCCNIIVDGGGVASTNYDDDNDDDDNNDDIG